MDFEATEQPSPTAKNETVMPRRLPNASYRVREHLMPAEVDRLVAEARNNRHGHRDATMIILAYRHGLRASELCALEWTQVSFETATLHVNRVKLGLPSTHPLTGDELRALRRLQRESTTSPFIFVSERGAPFGRAGFARMIERAAAGAGLEIKAHAHMLRHACGTYLASTGTDMLTIKSYLGHRDIRSTAHYTALASDCFKGLWHD